tara:strand:- start:103 stop:492 length:390 start_codon:yes stop_codon:yes gene_type:complete
MYIVHPALESGRLKDLILSVEKSMHGLGGTTSAINVWGKKKLAYPINKERYGMYILFQFQSDGISNKEFNLGLDHNANILTYLTTKIDKDTILSDLPSLDEQLGLTIIKKDENESDKDSSNDKIKEEEA